MDGVKYVVGKVERRKKVPRRQYNNQRPSVDVKIRQKLNDTLLLANAFYGLCAPNIHHHTSHFTYTAEGASAGNYSSETNNEHRKGAMPSCLKA